MKTRTSPRRRPKASPSPLHLLAVSGVAALGGCLASAPEFESEEAVSDEIRGAGDTPDTTFPAVGWMSPAGGGGCSMVRIGRNVALAAAHCMDRLSQGCATNRTGTVLMSASGRNPGGTGTLPFDDAAVAPGAYFRYGSCPPGSSNGCAAAATNGKNAGADLLLLHLPDATATAFDAQGARPMRVLTSLRDDVGNRYGAHAMLDDADSLPGHNFLNRRNPVTIVGWGASDSGARGIRRAGTMQLETTGANAWHHGCFQTTSCSGAGAFPGTSCSWTQRNGSVQSFTGDVFATDVLRLARTQTTPGSLVWNGPWSAPGDSGGPAVVRLYHPSDAFAENDRYVLGTASHITGALTPSPGSAGTGYIMAQYGATFSDESGLWIEKMQEYWDGANPEYARRNNGFSDWDSSPGGALNSSPGAASWGRGRIDAFALGTDDQMWHWDGTRWALPIGGTLRRVNPAATSWAPNRLDVFPVGTTGRVLHSYWNGSGWGGYEDLGVPPSGLMANTGVAAASWGRGRLAVYATNAQGRVFQKLYDEQPGGRGWGGWTALPTGVRTNDSPAAASWAPGRIDVFVRGNDSALWTISRDTHLPAMGWFNHTGRRGWGSLRTLIESAPAVASWAPGRLDVFARSLGTTPRLVQMTRSDGGWGTATFPLPSDGGIGAPAVTAWAPGRLDVVIRGARGLHRAFFPRP